MSLSSYSFNWLIDINRDGLIEDKHPKNIYIIQITYLDYLKGNIVIYYIK